MTMQLDPANDGTPWGHIIAILSLLGSLLALLPAVVALFAAVYYVIQIYESDTTQKWLEKRRMVRKARRIARLRAEQKVLLAELEALEVVREARVIATSKIAAAAHEAAVDSANHATHEKKNA